MVKIAIARKQAPEQNDQKDLRCAFAPKCIAKVTEDDWCSGCNFYICEYDSVNINMPFGGHDVVEHHDDPDEENDDDDES